MNNGWFQWLLAGLLAASASGAAAADVSAEATIVSDYRYRGLSLSNRRPAIQLSATIEHGSGLYASLWGSTIDEPDSNIGTELDLTAGYGVELGDGFGLDVSTTYYVYPSDSAANYVEANMVASAARNELTAAVGLSWIPRQRATRGEGGKDYRNLYVFASADQEIPDSPVTIKAQLGYERGFFDEAPDGGKLDWRLGAELELAPMTLGIEYVGYEAGASDDSRLVASLSSEF